MQKVANAVKEGNNTAKLCVHIFEHMAKYEKANDSPFKDISNLGTSTSSSSLEQDIEIANAKIIKII